MRKESRWGSRERAGSMESSRKKLLEVRIITGRAWILLHSDYAFNGSPTGHTTPPPAINGLIELTEHFVIFPSSIVILYQRETLMVPPYFSINFRGGRKLYDKHQLSSRSVTKKKSRKTHCGYFNLMAK